MSDSQYVAIDDKQCFLNYYNNLLHSLVNYNGGDIGTDKWYFIDSDLKANQYLDFSILQCPELTLDTSFKLTVDNDNIIHINSFQLVQVLIIELCHESHSFFRTYFRFILQCLRLRNNLSDSISQSDLPDLINGVLTTNFSKDGLYHTPSLPSYSVIFGGLPFERILEFCNKYKCHEFIDTSISVNRYERILNEQLESLYDMSLADYRKGATFNFLGLETGQLYADYLFQHFYENHIYVTTCLQVLRSMEDSLERYNRLTNTTRKVGIPVTTSRVLEGYEITKKWRDSLGSSRGMATEKLMLNLIPKEAKKLFIKTFNDYRLRASAINPKTIERLVDGFGLTMQFDAAEFFRSIAISRFYHEDNKEAGRLLKRYQSLVKLIIQSDPNFSAYLPTGVDFTKVNLTSLYKIMDSLAPPKLNHRNIMTYLKSSFKSLMHGNGEYKTYSDFNTALKNHTRAGCELVVAYTGWRGSEFGFSLNNIDIDENTDILDSAYIPFRFHVNWYVPKTSGNAILNREITSSTYILLENITKQFGTNRDLPCLFSESSNKYKISPPDKLRSYQNTARFIGANWLSFIENYVPFRDIDIIDSEKTMSKSISRKYRSSDLRLLRDVRDKLRQGFLRYQYFFYTQNKNVMIGDRKYALSTKLISEFQQGYIDDELVRKVYSQYVSHDSINWLKSQKKPFIELDQEVRKQFVRQLHDEVKGDLVFPTPHGWRHVWAEAVLTRYEGDVGAVIRHNFKHMSHRFFMAYIRDKVDQPIFTRAKRVALNSLVQKRISELERANPTLAGGFHKFIRKTINMYAIRIIKNSNELRSSEKRLLGEQISGRVIHFNTNIFSNCVSRKGMEGAAKCNQYGDLQPHDARPSFCLGCINADITSAHAQGIVQRLIPTVSSVLSGASAPFELSDHIDLFELAKRRLTEIRDSTNEVIVDEILPILDKAIAKANNSLQEFINEYS